MQSAAAEHGLKNVAQAGNEEPERSAEPGKPSRLGEEEGEPCGNEPHNDAQSVGKAGVEVAAFVENAFSVVMRGHETVHDVGVRAAERDDVALRGTYVGGGYGAVAAVADHGVFRHGCPFRMAVFAEMAQPRNSSEKRYES